MMLYSYENFLNNSFQLNMISLKLVIPWIRSTFDSIEASTFRKCFSKILKMDSFLNYHEEILNQNEQTQNNTESEVVINLQNAMEI